jgi:hypothetical protein
MFSFAFNEQRVGESRWHCGGMDAEDARGTSLAVGWELESRPNMSSSMSNEKRVGRTAKDARGTSSAAWWSSRLVGTTAEDARGTSLAVCWILRTGGGCGGGGGRL